MMAQQTPQEERSAVFMEVLEVCVHTILCLRRVYPAETFARHRAFGVPVWMSRHPGVNEFIADVLRSARGLVEANGVEKVSVCVLDGSNRVAERYAFEVNQAYELEQGADEVHAVNDTVYLMRALLMKLQVLEDQLPPPPADSTFALLLHSRDDAALRSFLASPAQGDWVDASDEDIAREPHDGLTSVWQVKQVTTPLLDFRLNVYYGSQQRQQSLGMLNHHHQLQPGTDLLSPASAISGDVLRSGLP